MLRAFSYDYAVRGRKGGRGRGGPLLTDNPVAYLEIQEKKRPPYSGLHPRRRKGKGKKERKKPVRLRLPSSSRAGPK